MNEQFKNNSLEKVLIDKENALWGTLKNKNPEQFSEFFEQYRKFFADDYHGVYGYGITAKDDEIEGARACSLQKFSLTEAEVVFPTENTAIVIYKIAVKNFVGEQDISGSFNSSSVWVNRDGEWRLILHTEARIKE